MGASLRPAATPSCWKTAGSADRNVYVTLYSAFGADATLQGNATTDAQGSR